MVAMQGGVHHVGHTSGIGRAFDGILTLAQVVVAVAALNCTILVTVEVLGTSLLNKAILGSLEFTQALLVVIIFFALGTEERNQNHISVDLVLGITGPRLRQITHIVSQVLALWHLGRRVSLPLPVRHR